MRHLLLFVKHCFSGPAHVWETTSWRTSHPLAKNFERRMPFAAESRALRSYKRLRSLLDGFSPSFCCYSLGRFYGRVGLYCKCCLGVSMAFLCGLTLQGAWAHLDRSSSKTVDRGANRLPHGFIIMHKMCASFKSQRSKVGTSKVQHVEYLTFKNLKRIKAV